jgi:pimeloyl-ACP methyl ester carboxylesterase
VSATATRYADNAGLHVAYQVLGGGPPDLVFLSPAMFSIDSIDEEPHFARHHERLASFARLIRLDLRGIGLSDPVLPTDPPSLEAFVSDIVAVLDAVGSESAYLFAADDGGAFAMLAAATQPERVAGLILLHCYPRLLRADDYPCGVPAKAFQRFRDISLTPASSDEEFFDLKMFAPKYADDPAIREWWRRAAARGAGPAIARMHFERRWHTDLRSLLPTIQAPTLVLHRRDNIAVRLCNSQYLAEHIPGARLVELPGQEHVSWLGDSEALASEIEEFLTGRRTGADPTRSLAAVLFTDIVGSTAAAQRLGDSEWRALLDRHDATVRRQIDRYGGEEVKTTGDGFLAVFTGPAAALQSAMTIGAAAQQIGIQVRCGVHVGEIQRRGSDVAGIAVHIAQRVQAAAGAGEVFASRTVRDLLAGSSFRFDDRGEQVLAGLDEPWQLYAVIG